MRPIFLILRCHTIDKERVMDILLDANEYERVDKYVDCWYVLGETKEERADTRKLVKDNVKKLNDEGIECETYYPILC